METPARSKKTFKNVLAFDRKVATTSAIPPIEIRKYMADGITLRSVNSKKPLKNIKTKRHAKA